MNIFCYKCGKKIDENDAFCEFCGANLKEEKVIEKKQEKHPISKRAELEGRAWFRAVKVIYISLIVISSLIVIGVSWSTIPEKTIDGYSSSILCYSGKSYAPAKNNIYVYGSSNQLDYSDDKDARILCKYDTLAFYNYQYENIDKNYTFVPKYNDVSYGDWFGGVLLALFILWLVSYLTKIAFFYIAIGEKPKIKIPD